MTPLHIFLLGSLMGIVIMILAMLILMPKMMLVQYRSRFESVDQTIEALKVAILKAGWRISGERNLSETIQKEGVDFPFLIRSVELCKAQYASKVLATNPEVSTLMPCAWGVYQGKDGNIYISTMNMGLMGRIFGGTIAQVMSQKVAPEEKEMLKEIIHI